MTRRELTVVGALLAAVIVLVVASLVTGAIAIPLGDLAATLVGQGTAKNELILFQLRLPRLTMAILVGVSFALAGAIFQALLSNPLASPDVIGITGGASAAAVGALLLGGASGFAVSGAAFAGAVAVASVIYVLSWRSGITGTRFVLIGIGLAFMVQAALGFLLTRADVRDAQAALVWLVGSLGSITWAEVAVAAISLAVLVPLVAVFVSRLRMLQLGDDTARGLGVPVGRVRLVLIALAVALAAAGTAAVGPLAFVAFVSGPIARRLVRGGGLALIPSALVGVVVVVAADFVAQHLLPGAVQVPAGILTGAIGAPYLLWLLGRMNRSKGFGQ